MSLTFIDIDNIQVNPDIWLCKPDRTAIHKIKDCYDVKLNLKFSAINELTFSIPALIERNYELVQNPLIKKMKERFLVKVKRDGLVEYFIILKINKQMATDGFESVSYQAYSTGIQIAQQLVRDYDEPSLNLSQHLREVLIRTNWGLDYVDAVFDLKYRAYEASSQNALQCVFDLAEKFNTAIRFDTVLQKMSFYEAKNLGKNKGFKLKDGVYLESFGLSIDPQNMVTRLAGYGAEGLDFRRLSPTGSNYIEDYSFFMFPFECDSSYRVLKSSNYMSDSLCIALTKYQDLLKSVDGQFKNLVQREADEQARKVTWEQTLSGHMAKDTDLKNQRDVINYTYTDKAPERDDWKALIKQIKDNEEWIAIWKVDIIRLEGIIEGIQNQIKALHELVRVENNFTRAQILEWNDYIIVKEYYNDSITDDEDLLEECITVFEDNRQPPLEFSLSLDNFLTSIDGNFHKDRKIELGDTIMVKSRDLNIDIKAKIIEITFDYESGGISIVVANTTRENDEYSELIEKLNLSSNTSTTVNIDKWKWDEGKEAKDDLTKYLNSVFDSAKQLITGGLNNSVTLNERGLISTDLRDNQALLMIQNGMMMISPDQGQSISVAIDKNGVHAEKLVGRIILGNKLWIEDEAGVITIQNAVMTVYDLQDKTRVHLGRYPDPDNSSRYKYGLRIYDGAIDIRTHEGNRGLQLDENGIRVYNNNGVKTFGVNSITGEVTIAGSLTIKTHPDDNRGVVIDGNGLRIYNNSGGIVFNADNFGNVWYAGRLEGATGTLNNVGGVFSGDLNAAGGDFTGTLRGVDGYFKGDLSAAGGTFTGILQAAQGEFAGIVTGTLSAQTISTIRLSADQITAGSIDAGSIRVDSLSAISSNLGTITAGTITGTTISGSTLNGVTINTDKNLYVGEYIIMQGNSRNTIYFGSLGSPTYIAGGDDLWLESWGDIHLNGLNIFVNGRKIA